MNLRLKFVLALAPFSLGLHAQTNPTLDPAFKPMFARAGGFASAVAAQSDGRLIVGGAFNAIAGTPRNGLARLNTDGSIDPTFDAGAVCCGAANVGSNVTPPVSYVALQPDGKVLVAGPFSVIGGVSRPGIARLNADGTLDTTFDVGTGFQFRGGAPTILSVIVQPDNKLLVAGAFTTVNGVARSGIVRLNPDGSVDTKFDAGTGFPNGDASDTGQLAAVALLPNGQILVGGVFQAINQVPRNGIARLNADGTLDAAFNPDLALETGSPSISGLVVQSDGRIAISGTFDVSNNQLRPGLARLKPDGSLDTGFNPNFDPSVESYTLLTQTSDGQFLAFHQFPDSSGIAHRAIGRLDANGTPDPAFDVELYNGQDGRFKFGNIAAGSNNTWVVAGDLSGDPSAAHQGLIRFTSAGTLDASFNPQFGLAELFANVSTLALQADNGILVGGSYDHVNGAVRPYLARLKSDGSLDTSFAPAFQGGGSQSVAALLVDTNGNILVGGTFTNVNGKAQNGLVRLKPDGTTDASFNVGSGAGDQGGVTALALQPDGSVLVAGSFPDFAGTGRGYLVRLTSTGALDPGFSPDFPTECALCSVPNITSLGVLTNGIVMVGGSISRVEAVFVNGLVRLRPDGSADFTTPLPPITADEQVTALFVGSDDSTTVALSSSSAATNSARLLRLNDDGTANTDFNPTNILGGPVTSMAADSSGRLVLAGDFRSVGGQPRNGLARLTTDGSLDTNFDAGTGFEPSVFTPPSSAGLVKAMVLQPDGGIVVGGSFAQANRQTRLGLARYVANDASGGDGGNGAMAAPPS